MELFFFKCVGRVFMELVVFKSLAFGGWQQFRNGTLKILRWILKSFAFGAWQRILVSEWDLENFKMDWNVFGSES